MKIITALGNEEINIKIKENKIGEIIIPDLQYQEAVLEVIKQNKEIDLLILSGILPGELNIYEFINIIKYKNQQMEIIIILEKEDNKLTEFLISKGINSIYYNNKNTINEILEKINKNNLINNKNNLINKKDKEKIIKKINIKKEIKNKFIKLKNNKKINLKNNKKIITIIGSKKIGKSIFLIILTKKIKTKKIAIINLYKKESNIKTIVGKKEKDGKISFSKNIDIYIIQEDKIIKKQEEKFLKISSQNIINQKDNNQKTNQNIVKKTIQNSEEILEKYDYIFWEIEDINNKQEILKKADTNIILIEPNLLGIKESKEILEEVIFTQKNQKDNIKIVFNKCSKYSIPKRILNLMYEDFEIIGQIKFSDDYDIFINSNTKFITKNIDKEYKKICKKIL